MAFLGDFGKTVDKVLHNPVVQVVFPVFAVANILAKSQVEKYAQKLTGGQSHGPGPMQPQQEQRIYGEQGPTIINVPQPYNQPYSPAYGQFQDPYYNPNFQGGSPWDFSTQYQVFSTAPSPTYSAPRADHTWEDLVTLGAGLFL